jgi:hypothetical protein
MRFSQRSQLGLGIKNLLPVKGKKILNPEQVIAII